MCIMFVFWVWCDWLDEIWYLFWWNGVLDFEIDGDVGGDDWVDVVGYFFMCWMYLVFFDCCDWCEIGDEGDVLIGVGVGDVCVGGDWEELWYDVV